MSSETSLPAAVEDALQTRLAEELRGLKEWGSAEALRKARGYMREGLRQGALIMDAHWRKKIGSLRQRLETDFTHAGRRVDDFLRSKDSR